MLRLVTAAVLAPLLWVLIKLAPPWAFLAVAGAGIVAGSDPDAELHETRLKLRAMLGALVEL